MCGGSTIKKLSWLAIIGLLVLLLATLQLASDTILNPQSVGAAYYSLLLKINAAGLFVLLMVIGANLVQLLVRLKRNEPGAKLTSRMVGIFTVLAITPVLIVYYYSVQFLYKGIDNWFDTEMESALHDSLDLSRASLKIRERDLIRNTHQMLVDIRNEDTTLLAVSLDKIRAANQAEELTLMRQDGTIVATSSTDSAIIPERLTQDMLLSLQEGTNIAVLAPLKEGELYLRVVVTRGPSSAFVLQALYPIPERLVSLGDSVEEAFEKHGRLSYMREHIKSNFTWTLSSVLMFSLFAAILAAFLSARRMVAPIQELAQGTAAIAAGNYEQKIELQRKDDLGFLVTSFNEMSEKIVQARDVAATSQQLVEDQRAYLQSILSGLSSGVLTFDQVGRLVTTNCAAGDILRVDFEPLLNQSGQALLSDSRLALFFSPILHRVTQQGEWREEVTLPASGSKQILLCHGTPLIRGGGDAAGHVVVFEDVTQLVQAQRDSAWGEVARRLAHEIKNPLTPIQLSAERLRHKYLNKMEEKDAKVLDRATSTIIAQVGTMKEMVNAFAEYAKKPEMKKLRMDVNQVVSEVAELYRIHQSVTLNLCLGQNIPPILADSGRLRQVMNNLLKNAFEAIEPVGGGEITVSTTYHDREPCINLSIEDNGPGFSAAVHGHVFEPYKTTKLKGTGLGLAIVKKIVEEHGGDIDAENTLSGACVTIHLPIIDDYLSANV